MALLVVLVRPEQSNASLRPSAVEALAELGVTSVALLRDEDTAALILEGWAFDPASHAAALTALGMADGGARALRPVVEMAVSAAAIEGGSP